MCKKMLSVLLCLYSTMLFAQAVKPSSYDEDHTSIVASAKQNLFVIRLKSNPTTGFSWFLREYDRALLIPIKHQFTKGELGLMGSPGQELWTFKAKPEAFIVPQQTVIRMVYSRPFQSNESSTQLSFRVSSQ